MAEKVTCKPFLREVPRVRWVFRHRRYLRYMAREFSCLFIGGWTLLAVVGLKRLSEGRAAYEAFLEGLRGPASAALLLLALCFAAYHSVTWFRLTPKAMPLWLGEKFAPDAAISGAHYAAWAVLSLAVLYFAGAF